MQLRNINPGGADVFSKTHVIDRWWESKMLQEWTADYIFTFTVLPKNTTSGATATGNFLNVQFWNGGKLHKNFKQYRKTV
jgi:hypothetical protein